MGTSLFLAPCIVFLALSGFSAAIEDKGNVTPLMSTGVYRLKTSSAPVNSTADQEFPAGGVLVVKSQRPGSTEIGLEDDWNNVPSDYENNADENLSAPLSLEVQRSPGLGVDPLVIAYSNPVPAASNRWDSGHGIKPARERSKVPKWWMQLFGDFRRRLERHVVASHRAALNEAAQRILLRQEEDLSVGGFLSSAVDQVADYITTAASTSNQPETADAVEVSNMTVFGAVNADSLNRHNGSFDGEEQLISPQTSNLGFQSASSEFPTSSESEVVGQPGLPGPTGKVQDSTVHRGVEEAVTTGILAPAVNISTNELQTPAREQEATPSPSATNQHQLRKRWHYSTSSEE